MKTIAIWHPFGFHGKESPEKILSRKRQEILANGWTLWSFRHMTCQTIKMWMQEINNEKPEHVLVLCSAGKYTKDPYKKIKHKNKSIPSIKLAKQYRRYQDSWQDIPRYNAVNQNDEGNIKIPHPSWTQKGLATAFKVSQILLPISDVMAPCQFNWLHVQPLVWKPNCDFDWLSTKDEKWKPIKLKRYWQGECLLRAYKKNSNTNRCLPFIRAVLKLQEPYFVEISCHKNKS